MTSTRIVALSGGVGGAKLTLGLSHLVAADQLLVVANTGDDFTHLGLRICPDLDTVMYTLADLNNKEVGWGQVGETWNFIDALKTLGGESWFQLGDRDLATHIVRTSLLASGQTLSDVTSHLCGQLGIKHTLVPMSDDEVATVVNTPAGESLAFQHYFVRDRCEPVVSSFDFDGLEVARPHPLLMKAIAAGATLIVCPSNPFVSVDPILMQNGVVAAMQDAGAGLVAVSPIVGGQAIKGPAAKMMSELGMPQTALGVAEHYVGKYPGIFKGFVIDKADEHLHPDIEALGLKTVVTNTVMVTLQDRIDLADQVLSLARELSPS